jgi:hypothetical protein
MRIETVYTKTPMQLKIIILDDTLYIEWSDCGLICENVPIDTVLSIFAF